MTARRTGSATRDSSRDGQLHKRATIPTPLNGPPALELAPGQQHPQPTGARDHAHKWAQQGENGHASTSHGHGPLLPPHGQHGRHQDPSRPGRCLSSSSPNNPALPPVLFYPLELSHQIPPLPVSLLDTITEPCSLLLVQELLWPWQCGSAGWSTVQTGPWSRQVQEPTNQCFSPDVLSLPPFPPL